MSTFETRGWDGDEGALRPLAALYGRVFAEPPYLEDPNENTAVFVERVLRYAATKPDLRLISAHLPDGEPIGLVLGSGVGPGDWWWDHVLPCLQPDARATWTARKCFSVAELAVAPRARRTGAASRLLQEVVVDLPYDVAALTCDPRATAAVGLYRSRGFETVSERLDLGDGIDRLLLARTLHPAGPELTS